METVHILKSEHKRPDLKLPILLSLVLAVILTSPLIQAEDKKYCESLLEDYLDLREQSHLDYEQYSNCLRRNRYDERRCIRERDLVRASCISQQFECLNFINNCPKLANMGEPITCKEIIAWCDEFLDWSEISR